VFGFIVLLLRCALVLVLAASSIGKLTHRSELAELTRTLRSGLRLPRAGLVTRAWVMLEGITAIGLALPATVGYASILAVGVLGCLTVGSGVLVAQHSGFACNCFGIRRSQLSWGAVLRNGALTGAAIGLVVGLRLRGAAAAPAPVLLAAVLTVLLGAVLIWQAGPLRALLRQAEIRRPAARVPALLGGRR
jgi:Methylamine utilisation protein MauE